MTSSYSAQHRRNIPEPSGKTVGDLYNWAVRLVLWWRERDQSREVVRLEGCISTDLPSASEDGIIIWVTDLGHPAVSFNGNWFPLNMGGAL